MLYPVELPSKYSAEPLVLISRQQMLTSDVIQLVRQQARDDINRSAVGVYPWCAMPAPALVGCAFCTTPIKAQAPCYRVSRRDKVDAAAVLVLPRMDGGHRYAMGWACDDCGPQFVFWKHQQQ